MTIKNCQMSDIDKCPLELGIKITHHWKPLNWDNLSSGTSAIFSHIHTVLSCISYKIITIAVIIVYLLCVRHFTCIITFNSHQSPLRDYLSPIYKLKKLNLEKVIQIVEERQALRDKICLAVNLCSYSLFNQDQ